MAAINWKGYDMELDRVSNQIEGLEERLKTIVCSLPPSLEEARESLETFKVRLYLLLTLTSCQDEISNMRKSRIK